MGDRFRSIGIDDIPEDIILMTGSIRDDFPWEEYEAILYGEYVEWLDMVTKGYRRTSTL